jgi:hypothetical protein
MHSGFPITEGWTMAAAAQGRAVNDFQLAAVARLEHLEIGFVVAIETIVVSMVPTMSHDDILMLFGNNNVPVGIQFQFGRALLIVADVAFEIRHVPTGTCQVCGGLACCGGADKVGIDQRDFGARGGMAPKIVIEGSGESEEAKTQSR